MKERNNIVLDLDIYYNQHKCYEAQELMREFCNHQLKQTLQTRVRGPMTSHQSPSEAYLSLSLIPKWQQITLWQPVLHTVYMSGPGEGKKGMVTPSYEKMRMGACAQIL